MEIDGKIYKNASGKNTSFFVKNYFSLEVVSPVNSDLTVNNTHSQSLVSFAPNISVATPDSSQNLEDVINNDFAGVHLATPVIYCVKTSSLQTKRTHPSVGANSLARRNFISEEGT